MTRSVSVGGQKGGNPASKASLGTRMIRCWEAGLQRLSADRVAVLHALMGQYYTAEENATLSLFRIELFQRLEAICAVATAASSKGVYLQPHELLLHRLRDEDKNNSGSLSRYSVLAAMVGLSIPMASVLGSALQKRLLHWLEVLGDDGCINIQDFLALIFDPAYTEYTTEVPSARFIGSAPVTSRSSSPTIQALSRLLNGAGLTSPSRAESPTTAPMKVTIGSKSTGEGTKPMVSWDVGRRTVNKENAKRVHKKMQALFTPTELDLFSQFRAQLFHRLEATVIMATGASTKGKYLEPHELLLARLKDEDKNGGGTLTRHSLLAAMASVGVHPAHLLGAPVQKRMLDMLEKVGQISIQDFLAVVYDSL